MDILEDAYTSYDDIADALLRSGRRLDRYATAHDPTPAVLRRLVAAARAEGWFDTLVGALADGRPARRDLAAWRDDHDVANRLAPPAAAPATPEQRLRALRVSDFDLADMRSDITARLTASGIVGFGIPTREVLVATTMCEHICATLGREMETRGLINLDAEVGTVELRVRQVREYREQLEVAGLAIPVLVGTRKKERIHEFWTGVRDALAGVPGPLALVFVTPHLRDLPDDVHRVRPPRMEYGQVLTFVRPIAQEFGFDFALAQQWASWVAGGSDPEATLDVRVTVDKLERSLGHLQADPSAFHRWLAERTRDARSTV